MNETNSMRLQRVGRLSTSLITLFEAEAELTLRDGQRIKVRYENGVKVGTEKVKDGGHYQRWVDKIRKLRVQLSADCFELYKEYRLPELKDLAGYVLNKHRNLLVIEARYNQLMNRLGGI